MPKLEIKSDADARKILKEIERRRKYRVMDFFEPYPKQREFFALGASKRERLLMAGNQLGKCISADTLIPHPDGTASSAGSLYRNGMPFAVWAWDGQQQVPAQAVSAIKKPAEPLVRVFLSDGATFECALNHRVLTRAGGWRFVGHLLESVPCLHPSTLEYGPQARAQGGRHWIERVRDSLADCFEGSRRGDALLRWGAALALSDVPSQAYALRHSLAELSSGGLGSRHTNKAQPESARPSNLGEAVRCAVRSAVFLSRNGCTSAQCSSRTRQAVLRLSIAVRALARSAAAILKRQYASEALVSPSGILQIIGYKLVGSQEVYDFTVPEFHNYIAAGVVHHNTFAGAFEASCHLTGMYPEWWAGRKWDRPTKGWASGVTSIVTRDVQQKLLCGEPGVDAAFGTGMIPKECFADKPSLARGITDAFDSIQVKHVSGGISVARFKSYEQGRTKFQGETLDWFWDDEEPDMEIYSEQLTRITATKGMGFVTFTPLKGMSDVVARFLNEPSDDRGVVTMTIEDALHIAAEERQRIIDGYPAHERDARARGIPMLGSGRVFPVAEDMIAEEFADPPAHWPKLWGIDFGTGHPFGAVLYAWDKDADCLHIVHAFRVKDARPMDHAKAMKPFGADIPVAWPRDGTNREANLKPLAALYREEGLNMLPEHATFPDGGVSTEAGIQEMHERMTTCRFKVAKHLTEWWEEFRMYHRKDGLIVKLRDDLMSASRIGLMMRRYARISGSRPEPKRAVSGYRPGRDRDDLYGRRKVA